MTIIIISCTVDQGPLKISLMYKTVHIEC